MLVAAWYCVSFTMTFTRKLIIEDDTDDDEDVRYRSSIVESNGFRRGIIKCTKKKIKIREHNADTTGVRVAILDQLSKS